MKSSMNRPKLKLLLHICCGCCGSFIPTRLSERLDVDLFYFNPNIHPEQEYLIRLANVQKVADAQNLPLIIGEYHPRTWLNKVKGFEQEPEGGARCPLCFEMRLRETARYAKEQGYDVFASTLTVGRNKKASIINPIGGRLAKEFGIPFLAHDFKKEGGQDASLCRSEELQILRQDYCGCIFSRKEKYLSHQAHL